MNEDNWEEWTVLGVETVGGVKYGLQRPILNEPNTVIRSMLVNDYTVSIFATREGSVKRPLRRIQPPMVKNVVRAAKRKLFDELLESVDEDAIRFDRAIDINMLMWEVNHVWPGFEDGSEPATVIAIIGNTDGTFWCFCAPNPGTRAEQRDIGFVVELLPLTVVGLEAELEPSKWEAVRKCAKEGSQEQQLNSVDFELDDDDDDDDLPVNGAGGEEEEEPDEPEPALHAGTNGTAPPALPTGSTFGEDALDAVGAKDEPSPPNN